MRDFMQKLRDLFHLWITDAQMKDYGYGRVAARV
jgi:hypothetical protein